VFYLAVVNNAGTAKERRVSPQRSRINEGGSMARANFVNVDGAQVAYRVQGKGLAVVLVNGAGGQDVQWGPLIERLSSQRTVISLDYSGAGDTVDDGSALTLEKVSRQVMGVAEAAGAETFDLIGYSLGSVIATFIAADYPKLVRAAVLLTGFLWGGDPGLKLQFDLWLDVIRTNHQAYIKLLLHSGLTPAFLTSLGTPQIEQMVEGFTSTMNWEGYKRQVELNLKVDIRAQAQRVTRPVLAIGATQDRILPSPQTRALADSIPQASYKEVDAGHGVLLERADEFIALATEFLFQQHD
jgi:3-oxoadipate enol-lactonase